MCEWLSSYALGLITLSLIGKLSCPSTFPHTSPPSCDGDLEFSGVQIHAFPKIHTIPTTVLWASFLTETSVKAPLVFQNWPPMVYYSPSPILEALRIYAHSTILGEEPPNLVGFHLGLELPSGYP